MPNFDKLRTGTDAMKSGKGGGYLNNIYWDKTEINEPKYLAFFTKLEDVPKLGIHFIQTAKGWRTFICRRNEIFDEESNGECEICAMKSLGKKAEPQYKHFALALELDPIYDRTDGRETVTGYKVKMDEWEDKEGKKRTTPRFGVVSESAKNFWTPFSAHVLRLSNKGRPGELEEVVYEIVRNGKGDQTSYSFYEDDNRPDLSELEVPSLYDFIEEKGSAEYYKEQLSGGVSEEEAEEAEEAPRENGEQEESDFDKLKAELESK